MTTTDPNWREGDPLYAQALHSNYLFNFRDEPTGVVCNCADAARWPVPQTVCYELGRDDELAAFIAEWHRWHEAVA